MYWTRYYIVGNNGREVFYLKPYYTYTLIDLETLERKFMRGQEIIDYKKQGNEDYETVKDINGETIGLLKLLKMNDKVTDKGEVYDLCEELGGVSIGTMIVGKKSASLGVSYKGVNKLFTVTFLSPVVYCQFELEDFEIKEDCIEIYGTFFETLEGKPNSFSSYLRCFDFIIKLYKDDFTVNIQGNDMDLDDFKVKKKDSLNCDLQTALSKEKFFFAR